MGPLTKLKPQKRLKKYAEQKAILDALRRIVQGLRNSSRRCEQFTKLTIAQFFVLQHIRANNGLSVNELAALTYTHQSTVSEVVGRLESLGLIRRKKSRRDARQIEIHITLGGQNILASMPKTMQERLVIAIKTLSSKDTAHLARLLSVLVLESGLSKQQPLLFFEKNAQGNGAFKGKNHVEKK